MIFDFFCKCVCAVTCVESGDKALEFLGLLNCQSPEVNSDKGHIDDDHHDDDILNEITIVKDVELAGNASVGVSIDRSRNRLLVVVTDLIGNRYSGLAAYDLSSWKRLFLTHLTKPGNFFSFLFFKIYFN